MEHPQLNSEAESAEDSKNLESAVDDMVPKYEDSEALSSQNEEDQSGEQVYGYLYRSAGSEDATIYVDSRGFNLNGQSLIVTQNDDGNEIIVLVGEDPDGQPLDQTFAHSVLQSDEVSFEDGLKEHGTLVVDEHSQELEFIKSSEDVPEEHEERHMYIENSGEILNISNENVSSPVDIEPPLWSNSGHLKNDGTEMLFIPNPTVVIAPEREETKHRKLMQLACIAHELQSADQKSSSSVICDYVKDPETSYESPVEKTSADEADDKSHGKEKCINFNSKSVKVYSPILSGSSTRVVDNTVSVIHSTSSELQSQTKLSSSPPDFSNSESELLYTNISHVPFHDNLVGSSSTKQHDECSKDDLKESGPSSVPEIADDRCSVQKDNLELNSGDSPLTFIDKTHNLNADNLNTEDNALGDIDPDEKMDDDTHVDSAAFLMESENPKSHDSGSNLSLMKCHLSKETDMSETTFQEENDPDETISDIDDDNISSTEHSVSVSENESSFLSNQYVFNYKKKSLGKTPTASLKPQTSNDQIGSDMKVDDENRKENDFEQSPSENLDSNLVIAEMDEDRESKPDEVESNNDTSAFRKNLKSKSPADSSKLVSTDKEALVHPNVEHECSTLADGHSSQLNELYDEANQNKAVNLSSSLVTEVSSDKIQSLENDIEAGDSVSGLSAMSLKTYHLNKSKKSVVEDSDQNEIVLYNDADTMDESYRKSPSPQANATEIDDINYESKVYAPRNYVNSIPKEKYFYRKKKQSLRAHNLRTRSPLNNGSSEVSASDSKNNSLSDNIPWGNVLLETSFEPCTVPNDVPSTSFAPQYPTETSTPLLSPEQRRRKLNKYKRDFDRLLNSSSPIAIKQPKISKKFSSRMHPNVIKATKSRYSSGHFSRLSKSSSSSLNSLPKSSPGKKVQVKGQKPKEAKIQYLHPCSDTQPSEATDLNRSDLFTCSSCNFASAFVDNLIEHLKYCSSRQPIFDYEVNNMDKRQRIRGEEDITQTVNNALKKIRSDLRSSFLDDDPSVSHFGDDERDSDNVKKKKRLLKQYGYGDDDVVWVKFKDRFWPALVCSIDGLKANVKLIGYPKEVKGLKVKHENIRTFDNSKWNLLCLAEAEALPHNEIFVKAVQSCERFSSKKFLGIPVTGKEFFSVRDEVDFATDSASSDSIVNEDSDSEIEYTEPARKARYSKLDLPRIHEHLINGNADDYVLDIYHKKKHSQKHATFFTRDNSTLKHRPWFGPFEDKKQQEQLFCHFRDLFLNKIGKRGFFVSYVCQVMIPEAIVQAISVVKDIPLKDAEILFESEDSLDLENEDPSVEDILKKYS